MATKTLVKARASTATTKTVKRVAAPAKVVKKAVVSKAAAKPVKRAAAATPAPLKPCRRTFTATEQMDMYAESAGIDRKQVKAVLAVQQRLLYASLMPGGIGAIKMMGINFKSLKKPAVKMPAIKKGAMTKGFGGVEVVSPGRAAFTKPAKMMFKARALKALKDALIV